MWKVRGWALMLGMTMAALLAAFAVARPWYDLACDAVLVIFAAVRLRKAMEAKQ